MYTISQLPLRYSNKLHLQQKLQSAPVLDIQFCLGMHCVEIRVDNFGNMAVYYVKVYLTIIRLHICGQLIAYN